MSTAIDRDFGSSRRRSIAEDTSARKHLTATESQGFPSKPTLELFTEL